MIARAAIAAPMIRISRRSGARAIVGLFKYQWPNSIAAMVVPSTRPPVTTSAVEQPPCRGVSPAGTGRASEPARARQGDRRPKAQRPARGFSYSHSTPPT